VTDTAWTSEELERIGGADELELAARRSDGKPRRPVTIWVVRVRDDLYIRSWRGAGASWFHAAKARPEAPISAAGVERDVAFLDADDEINDDVDAAYRTKYQRYADGYVGPMIAPEARATTLKLVPTGL
jgi:hypothetical protein